MKAFRFGCLVGALLGLFAPQARAQTSKSAPLAKELVAALAAAKLENIAAKDPAAPDIFFAALYMPGLQLLVVSGSYAEPSLLETRIYRKEYRDVYVDLSSASSAATRVLIEDLGSDGVKVKREGKLLPFDSVELGGKRTMFDGDWKKQKLSEEVYMTNFGVADERYAQILTALLAQAKRGS